VTRVVARRLYMCACAWCFVGKRNPSPRHAAHTTLSFQGRGGGRSPTPACQSDRSLKFSANGTVPVARLTPSTRSTRIYLSVHGSIHSYACALPGSSLWLYCENATEKRKAALGSLHEHSMSIYRGCQKGLYSRVAHTAC